MRFPKNGTDYFTPLSLSNSGATRSSHENKRELHPPRAAFFVTGGEGNLRTGLLAVRSYMAGRSWMMA